MASVTRRSSSRVILDERTGNEKVVTIERYRARYRDEAGREHARHFVKKAAAQRWLDEVTAAEVRGDYVDPEALRQQEAWPSLAGESSIMERHGQFERQRMDDALFRDCSLARALFDDVNLGEARFSNVNLSGSRLDNVNLSGVAIDNANIEGLTIFGYDIHKLIDDEMKRENRS